MFVPPLCLLFKVLQYMKQCRVYGTDVLPMWKSASFWPMLSGADPGFGIRGGVSRRVFWGLLKVPQRFQDRALVGDPGGYPP